MMCGSNESTFVFGLRLVSFLIPSFFHPIGGTTRTPTIGTRRRPRCGGGIVPVPIPIERRMVIGIPLRPEQIPEHTPEVGNIGFRFEFERTAIGQVFGKLRRTSLTQRGDRNGLFLFHNEFVLFRRTLRFQSLPRQAAL